MHSSFSVEVPIACRARVVEVLAGRIERPCVVVTRVAMLKGTEAVEVRCAPHEKVIINDATKADFDRVVLSEAGMALRDTPNAGGASVRSEVMSIEVLQRAFKAKLLATETEAWYWPAHSPITDYVCEINGETLGVSVTRAFHFVDASRFTTSDARRLLAKKLQGVLNSTQGIVFPEFRRQILHVFCKTQNIAKMVLQEYKTLKAKLRANTILFLTVCEAEWMYTEKCVVFKPKVKKGKRGERANEEEKGQVKEHEREKEKEEKKDGACAPRGHRTKHHLEKRARKRLAYQKRMAGRYPKMVVAVLAMLLGLALLLFSAAFYITIACGSSLWKSIKK